jgi:hypothetical protein
MSQSQRQPRSPTPGSGAAIHPEVRVRFTLSDGLSVLLRRLPNSFGWVGTGTLRFADHGVYVTAMCRPFFGLHRSRRFVSAFEIREVYREGSAVRVDLRAAGVERPFFWFWAEDAAAAAAVVKLLASKQSVEFDDGFSERPARSTAQPRGAWVAVATLILMLPVAAALMWLARPRHAAQTPVSVEEPRRSTSSARPRPSQPDVALARIELDRFDSETSALELEFSTSFDALQRGSLSQEDFVNRLDRSLVPRWEAVQRQLTSNPLPVGTAAASVREALARSAVKWQWALRIYGAGLRVHDSNVVLIAFEHFRQAADARRQAEERLHDFEGTRP